jgi:hypothetical protein
MNKLFNKVFAASMAVVMVAGSSMTVFAEGPVNSATGAGESTGHLDTNVVTAVLPTSSVDSLFAFTIDPENILAKAGKIKGSTAVTSNADKVYFLADGGDYASTSQAVKIGAKNYIAADVSVKAEVGEAAEGKTIIPLAESEEALAAATEPTLLLTLAVGDKTGVITADGVTVVDQIEEQSANFEVVWDDTNKKYKLATKDGVQDADWDNKEVSMSGKIGGTGTTSDDVVAPEVALTWTVKAHQDGPAATPASMSTAAKSAVISNLEDGVTLTSAKVVKVDNSQVSLTASTQYTFKNNTFAIVSGKEVLLDNTKYTKFVLTFSDDSVVNIPIVAAD